MNDILLMMLAYGTLLVLLFILLNLYTDGFLLAFVRTKAGRGKKVLVLVKGQLDTYYSKGWISGRKFYYVDRETKRDNKNKVPKFVDFDPNDENPIFRLFNIPVVMIDEISGKFIHNRTGELSGTFDPIQQENLIIRALQKPSDEKSILLVIVLIGVILLLLVNAFIVMTLLKIPPQIESLKAVSQVVGVNV